MKQDIQPTRDFKSLSVHDLLDAREAYHVHLANMSNVIATAIGLYRIRTDDPDADKPLPRDKWRSRTKSPERTLENTVVQPWSWPCVLIFVKQWQTQEELAQINPDYVVPHFLYLSDGRVVPTCVVLAQEQEQTSPPLRDASFPHDLLGGGYPLLTDVQGQEHIGSTGCLVYDGNAVYALTNKHVCGDPTNDVFTVADSQRQVIGKADQRQLGKLSFAQVYPAWSETSSHINLDAGLIRIADINRWTAQVFGLGELGDIVNLHTDTITLDLIGKRVCAFGAASGKMTGEIQALFYRYKSIGGVDYISDLLIGSRIGETPLQTMPGDSGTIWCLDPLENHATTGHTAHGNGKRKHAKNLAPRLRPLALQWGGHVIQTEQGKAPLRFALSTCLSTVCRELDVDLLPSWNIGHREYWGEVGHFKIAASACDLVQSPHLHTLFANNTSNIAYGDDELAQGTFHSHGNHAFVPLADVADIVWRITRHQDAANHFADMDQEGQGQFQGKTLLNLCKDPNNLDIDVWNQFYDSIGVNDKRGALPFRVWQLYDEMVDAVKQQDVAHFVCTAGVLAHYIGDACQPLHVSRLHDGDPDTQRGKGVHSTYESAMLNRFTSELIDGVNEKVQNTPHPKTVSGGKAAGLAIVELMRDSLAFLPPEKIIDTYLTSMQMNDHLAYMWDQLGAPTEQLLANGAHMLACIWESAWQEGTGEQNIPVQDLSAIAPETLQQLYSDPEVASSYRLQDPQFAQALKIAVPAGAHIRR